MNRKLYYLYYIQYKYSCDCHQVKNQTNPNWSNHFLWDNFQNYS